MLVAHETIGTGSDVVFLHPIGLDGRSWSKVADRLDGFTCHLVDLPGHGRSPSLPGQPGLDDYADEIAALLARLNLSNFTLVGLSFGGMIAQILASRRIGGLSGAVLCGCACTFPQAARPQIRARGERALAGGMAAVLDETMERWFSAEFRTSGDVSEVARRLLDDNPADWAAAWSAISELEMRERLAAVDVPTLCIAGENDAASPPDVVKMMAEAIPGATVMTLPNAPHMMHWETPSALATELARFVTRSVAGR